MIQVEHHHTPEKPIRSCRESKRGCPDAGATAPGLVAKVTHAAQAAARIVGAALKGQPVRVSTDERTRRLSICRHCNYWRDGGNFGLGECQHSQCGCTRAKHGLATEKCPLNKWA